MVEVRPAAAGRVDGMSPEHRFGLLPQTPRPAPRAAKCPPERLGSETLSRYHGALAFRLVRKTGQTGNVGLHFSEESKWARDDAMGLV